MAYESKHHAIAVAWAAELDNAMVGRSAGCHRALRPPRGREGGLRLGGDLTQARTDLAKIRTLSVLPLTQTQIAASEELIKLRDTLPADARKVFDEEVTKAPAGMLNGL